MFSCARPLYILGIFSHRTASKKTRRVLCVQSLVDRNHLREYYFIDYFTACRVRQSAKVASRRARACLLPNNNKIEEATPIAARLQRSITCGACSESLCALCMHTDSQISVGTRLLLCNTHFASKKCMATRITTCCVYIRVLIWEFCAPTRQRCFYFFSGEVCAKNSINYTLGCTRRQCCEF